jgi:putative oxidoreductase
MESAVSNIFIVIGRVLLGALFVVAGLNKLKTGFDAGSLEQLAKYIAGRGLPQPQALAYAAVAFEIVAGLALIFGFFVLPVSALLAAFCLVTALFFHNFWTFPAEQMPNQMNHFVKNMALTGAFLVLFGSRLRS